MINSDSTLLTEKLKRKCSDRTQKLYLSLHKSIIRLAKNNIDFDIYPIYVTYYNIKTDRVFVIIYLNKDFLEVGFALNKKQKYKGVKDAGFMKYPGITKYIRIESHGDIGANIRKIMALSYVNVGENTD